MYCKISNRIEKFEDSSSKFILTDYERDHIEMYRDLDHIGQHIVDAVTKAEFERVKKEKE